jgi:hypothetical protein
MKNEILDMITSLHYVRDYNMSHYYKDTVINTVIDYFMKDQEAIDEQTMEHQVSYFLGINE